jgi:hypothetical protein
VQILLFLAPEKASNYENGVIWCLPVWGKLRILTRNGRRGADFHMWAGKRLCVLIETEKDF